MIRPCKKSVVQKIGMIFQEPMTSLNPVLTIGYQIGEPLTAHLGLKGDALKSRISALLQQVGIPPERADSYPDELSGGQRQRVMIAMSIACEPALLIADEPTTALDVTVQAQVLKLLDELKTRVCLHPVRQPARFWRGRRCRG